MHSVLQIPETIAKVKPPHINKWYQAISPPQKKTPKRTIKPNTSKKDTQPVHKIEFSIQKCAMLRMKNGGKKTTLMRIAKSVKHKNAREEGKVIKKICRGKKRRKEFLKTNFSRRNLIKGINT